MQDKATAVRKLAAHRPMNLAGGGESEAVDALMAYIKQGCILKCTPEGRHTLMRLISERYVTSAGQPGEGCRLISYNVDPATVRAAERAGLIRLDWATSIFALSEDL